MHRPGVAHRFIEDHFPLLIVISPRGGYDEAAIREMDAWYEQLWARGARYALISASPRDAEATSARGRKLIAEWANRPRVRRMSREHCVGSATIVEGTVARGALTALMWLWTPASPHKAVATPEEALAWCLEHIRSAGLELPEPEEKLRKRAIATLREA